MDFLPIFIKMVELFLIIILGYIANKAGIFCAKEKQALSKLIINVTMPCTIMSAVLNAEALPSIRGIGLLLLVSFSSYGVLYLLAKFFAFVLRFEGQKKAVVEFGLMFANVGFIGYPITQAIFGEDSLFYTTVFNLPFNLLCYSVGVHFIQKGNMATGGDVTEEKKSIKSLLLSPALLFSVLALFLALISFDGSKVSVLGATTDIVGAITTPGALLVIGSALAEMPFREMFNNAKAYVLTVICVIITPLLMYLIYSPITKSDPLLLGEAVIITGMPVATAGTMLCVEYGGDEKFMAQFTFLTTLASIVTIPLLATIL